MTIVQSSSAPPSPFANILHRDAIKRLATDRSYERGVAYFEQGRIRGLTRHEASIRASVRGSMDYVVQIWVREEGLAYRCTCPQGEDKAFCKHAVALGLAWLAHAATSTRVATLSGDHAEAAIERALDRLPRKVLVDVLRDLAREDEAVRARLIRLATSS